MIIWYYHCRYILRRSQIEYSWNYCFLAFYCASLVCSSNEPAPPTKICTSRCHVFRTPKINSQYETHKLLYLPTHTHTQHTQNNEAAHPEQNTIPKWASIFIFTQEAVAECANNSSNIQNDNFIYYYAMTVNDVCASPRHISKCLHK